MIQFIHVTKIIENKYTVLDDVSFQIQGGEFAFLTGPSGAGKTTIMRHIYMQDIPTTGQVFCCGFTSHEIRSGDLPFLRRRLGIVFQDFKLMNDRNVFENVAVSLRISGEKEQTIKKKVMQVLGDVGLNYKIFDYPEHLSGGEQQRLAIARAIANDPYVLLADEPTGNLDLQTGREIVALLRRINAAGTAILMATHDVQLIEKMPYRVLRIEHGKMLTREY